MYTERETGKRKVQRDLLFLVCLVKLHIINHPRSPKEVTLEVFIALDLALKGKKVISPSEGRFTIIALLFDHLV